ncbi:MAG: hypothetical protein LIP09_08730 [Bacteroidales bacterium]|nr:hypothetical protein [Bacteroidales bacterium]
MSEAVKTIIGIVTIITLLVVVYKASKDNMKLFNWGVNLIVIGTSITLFTIMCLKNYEIKSMADTETYITIIIGSIAVFMATIFAVKIRDDKGIKTFLVSLALCCDLIIFLSIEASANKYKKLLTLDEWYQEPETRELRYQWTETCLDGHAILEVRSKLTQEDTIRYELVGLDGNPELWVDHNILCRKNTEKVCEGFERIVSAHDPRCCCGKESDGGCSLDQTPIALKAKQNDSNVIIVDEEHFGHLFSVCYASLEGAYLNRLKPCTYGKILGVTHSKTCPCIEQDIITSED